MVGLLILVTICTIMLLISRNNLKQRTVELRTNLIKFNNEIIEFFYSMPNNYQSTFLSSLTPSWRLNLESILKDNFKYANNVWSLQQQIIEQQELFMELRNFSTKILDK